MSALIGALGAIGSALIGGGTAAASAKANADATKYAARLQRQNFLDTQEALAPQIEAGNLAREQQMSLLGLAGDGQSAVETLRSTPGYQFAFDTGQEAVQGSAAAGGSLFSGKTLKDLTRFGQGLADQTLGAHFNRLGTLAGGGSAATGQQIATGTQTAGTLGQLALQGADARESSYVTGANAAIGGIQGLANLSNYYGGAKAGTPAATFNPYTASQGFY